METQTQIKTSAKDFFINLGAIVALYTTVVSLLNLLFRVINTAYPQITNYYYSSSQSISFPVSTIIIFFPIFVLLMWLLERGYVIEPDKKQLGIRKWLTYITLFVAGLTLAGDLVTVLFYFIDGQELTTGFLLKILSVFVVILIVFLYYISDIRNKLTSKYRKIWLGISVVVIIGSVVWGFSVLGSPRTQQLLKYDEQRVNDLQTISSVVQYDFQNKGGLPNKLSDLSSSNSNYSSFNFNDRQTGKPYEYNKTGDKSYELCAEFNKASNNNAVTSPIYAYPNTGVTSWTHPAGRYCFSLTVTVNQYQNGVLVPAPAPLVK